ncbi:MAG TPA: glycosyltransferase [Acidimicrobiia bacterium]|jgi:cellulose synthase/poly-beta-1,6-N-acetylglucosamine synthase-like glycosyltransferase
MSPEAFVRYTSLLIVMYIVALNLVYLALTVVAFGGLRKYVARLKSLDIQDLLYSAGTIPMAILVPAYNEEATIVASVRSFLTLNYPDYEVVIVNDGSNDATLQSLVDAFDLAPADRLPTSTVATAVVRAVYHGSTHPNLWVIDKENGGKADALNVGLNYSRSPVFCALDADTILESEALLRVVRPFLEDTTTIAAGGIIRIANGCRIDGGVVEEIMVPAKTLPRLQVVEYLRAFLAARVGWDAVGGTLIISGAFGAFRRSLVAEIGGYSPETVGEDMELVVRLHRHCRERQIPYRVAFLADPVAWTEAPESLTVLGSQRERWQRGLAQVLMKHRDMILRPKYGTPGMVSMPYFVLFELMGPLMEILGYATIALAAMLGIISPIYLLAFVILGISFGTLLSLSALALEELSFRRYRRGGDLVRLFFISILDGIGFRQLVSYWRVKGMVRALRTRRATRWDAIPRKGFGDPASGPSARSAGAGSAPADRRVAASR